ncbi:hypothetical protein PRIPAC_91191 [Pristionchus pacificus]|uniref:Uncharacterized protein n=1 Tax=Pristionchus pacificus TaxID=54126 RepID=A0A2A6B8I6_PRIPA|nr:hypothetical protein PRIPAC_91191 [Pristionchus pacificus]|eukprot:PDM62185.1 hypothetical protein PRIPAC_51627 [Pristionchus pacificus]
MAQDLFIFTRPEWSARSTLWWSGVRAIDGTTVHAKGRPFSTICCYYSCAILGQHFLGGSDRGIRRSEVVSVAAKRFAVRPATVATSGS